MPCLPQGEVNLLFYLAQFRCPSEISVKSFMLGRVVLLFLSNCPFENCSQSQVFKFELGAHSIYTEKMITLNRACWAIPVPALQKDWRWDPQLWLPTAHKQLRGHPKTRDLWALGRGLGGWRISVQNVLKIWLFSGESKTS